MRTVNRAAIPAVIAAAVLGATPFSAWSAQTSFERVASPDVSELINRLHGAYAVAEDDVWAVGGGGGNEQRTLVERWDGSSISVVSSPHQSGMNDELVDIDGTGANDIWAVGSIGQPGSGTETLVQHWDGAEWTTVPSPNLGFTADHTALSAVAAIAPDDAWAVGTFRTKDFPTTTEAVILHWDGSSWRSVATGCEPGLESVSANGSNDIWAVGGEFACHFDGAAWTAVRVAADPIPDRRVNLLDVATLGPNDAWGVGYVSIPCGENVCADGEIQHWDGARWTRVATIPDVWILGVHAISPTDVWASTTTGLLHFDGTAWTRVATPTASLADVTATPSGTVWAVGSTSFSGSPASTVVLRG